MSSKPNAGDYSVTRNAAKKHADGKPTIMTDGGVEIICQADERGPLGDRDPCDEFLVVDGEKIPVTGVRIACYEGVGRPPEDVIDFNRVERDGDDLYAIKMYGDELLELCRGQSGAWEMYYHEHPTDVEFEVVWERGGEVE